MSGYSYAKDCFWEALREAPEDMTKFGCYLADQDIVDGYGSEIVGALLAYGWMPPSAEARAADELAAVSRDLGLYDRTDGPQP